jgi:predicted RNase H-like nuclease (RuvC/YqgF family)
MTLPKSAWIFKDCQGKSAWPVSFSKASIADAEEYVRKADVEAVDTTSLDNEIAKLKAENKKLKGEVKDLKALNEELGGHLKELESELEYLHSEE